jgi:hypothetical protein
MAKGSGIEGPISRLKTFVRVTPDQRVPSRTKSPKNGKSNHKGDNTMQYEAPQVLQTVDASRHIKGGDKGKNIYRDSMNPLDFNSTPGAYEADE